MAVCVSSKIGLKPLSLDSYTYQRIDQYEIGAIAVFLADIEVLLLICRLLLIYAYLASI